LRINCQLGFILNQIEIGGEMGFKEDELRKVLSNVFNISEETVNEATSIDNVEDWDSLKHLELVLALEEKFDVTLTEEEVVEILNYPLIKMTLETHGIQFDDGAG